MVPLVKACFPCRRSARDNVLQSVTAGQVTGKSHGTYADRGRQPHLHRPEERTTPAEQISRGPGGVSLRRSGEMNWRLVDVAVVV
jgi:hypothetical protein